MSDPRDLRLPDIPNAGYASEKQKVATDAIMFWCRNIERDRLLLLNIVVEGRDKWYRAVKEPWCLASAGRASALSRDLADRVFDYMEALAGPSPATQLLILMGQRAQQAREVWDHRQSTKRAFEKQLRKELTDLQHYGTKGGSH